ncbi:MAG: T9SS type A sorting domain-containing protein [Bacteroidetes bacterium]|nr:T9SS type A sorting domain-containing protein [Bacteroidota bacterium]
MKNFLPFFFIMAFFASHNAFSQLIRNLNIPVKVNNQYIPNPWAGGLNWCQFSEIDLDGDGKMDLFVFDRNGDKISTFLNKGENGVIDYQYAPEYAAKFPRLKSWALLRDYNCNGKMDIFTYSDSGGIALYRNDFANGNLQFSLVSPLLRSNYSPSSPNTGLYVSSEDIPAIIDIDGDGDLDILTFSAWGAAVELHLNESMEKFGNCNELAYTVETHCWGNFSEDNNSNISLNKTCRGGGGGDNSGQSRHAGSTLLALDLNKDGAMDLVLGDIGNKNLTMLLNGETSVNANIISINHNFPTSSDPVDMNLFPAAYYIDVDNDGIKDLIVSPNAGNISANYSSVWLYTNHNKNDSALFSLIKKNFLQDGMIDVGEGSFPALFDYNNDGLLDLIIGNHSFSSPQGNNSTLTLFKNIGTKSAPAFELVSNDYLGLSALNLRGLFPTFGDLDGDGDMDLLLGEDTGNLLYFENTASAGNTANFELQSSKYFSLRAGNNAAPQLFDLNKNGKLDIIIGTQNGILAYFENTGTINAPSFTQSRMIRPFGGVDVRLHGHTTGNSVPNFYLDKVDNKIKLLVGSDNGRIYYYENIEGNLNGTFNLVNSHVGVLSEGRRTAPLISFNLTDQPNPVLLVGNYAGGISYFDNAINLSVENKKQVISSLKVYPVPASGNITVEPGNDFTSQLTISIYNLIGNKIFEQVYAPGNSIVIETESFADGLYFLHANAPGKSATEKIIIKR